MRTFEQFARAHSTDVTAPQLDEPAVVDLLAVIERAVRTTLHVGLRPSDGSQRNQDALELVNDAWMKLQQRLVEGTPVQNPRAYAFLTARKLCFDHLRRRSVLQRSLRDSALRFLRVTPGLAAWKTDGRWLTGFDRWEAEGRRAVPSDQLCALLSAQNSLCDANHGTLNWTAYKRAAWRRLFLGIFAATDAPLWLDDLIVVISGATNPPKFREVELDGIDSPQPSPDIHIKGRQELAATWREIATLPRPQRVALLLNSIDGGLDRFAFSGIATLQELAATLELTREEFTILERASPAYGAEIAAAGPMSDDERFAILWRHVPLTDDAIAMLLGLTRQDVVNRRMAARQRLHRRLASMLGPRRQTRQRDGARPTRPSRHLNKLPSMQADVNTCAEASPDAQPPHAGRTPPLSSQGSRAA
jgi:DNA-directed RNA polymerase specialized sigma24 family protein